jgi:hypothetical protein
MAATAESIATSVGPERIMEVAFGFAASKTLLSAAELDLFTELGGGPLTLDEISSRLGLHPRASRDFLDALVALGFLEREDGLYWNSPAAAAYLDRTQPGYIGGIIRMMNTRLYGFWGSLTEALRTGLPQSESRTCSDPFQKLYSEPALAKQFLSAMTGLSVLSGQALAEKFPWTKYSTFADIGCAQGAVAVEVARAHPHLRGIGFDLAPVGPVFSEYAAEAGVAGRVKFVTGSFFEDPLPRADVLIMGHILHDWDMGTKRMLLDKAYAALPVGGVLIVHEMLIDDERKYNPLGLLASLNMLIETPGGFDFTGADCQGWMRAAGFRSTLVEALAGADSMVVGIK